MVSESFIFVSYNQADRAWAEWIAWILEEDGFVARLQDWDFRGNFVLEMDEAVRDAAQTVAVLSRDYQNAKFTHSECAAAFAQDPKSVDNKLIPVRVGDCKPDGLLGQISFVDLVDKDEDAAASMLLARVRGERGKPPSKPGFPGRSKKPDFPNAPVSEKPPDKKPAPSLIAIPTTDWPKILGEPPDSLLLRAESRCVRFHEHAKGWRQEIVGWAMEPEPSIILRLQTGRGGAGKTRLAIDICETLAKHGWMTGFLRPGQDPDRELPALLDLGKSCLIVIDYAETRVEEIVNLTRKILYWSNVPIVRLLLLARGSGDWWKFLGQQAKRADDSTLAAVLSNPSTKQGPFPMGRQPVDEEFRPNLFKEALADFAKTTGREVPDAPVPDLSGEHFQRVLFLHLAALASLRGENVTSDLELLQSALRHERTYWKHLLENEGLKEIWQEPAFEQGLALLTLLGGTTSAKETKDIIRRTPRLAKAPDADQQQIFDLLRRLYPDRGGVRGLEPDLLGERLVAACLSLDDELLDAAFGPIATADDATSAFTVLARLARHHDDDRQWLALALERYLKHWTDQAVDVAKETGAPMPELIAEALKKGDRQTRRSMAEQLPNLPDDTVNLQDLAVEVTIQKLRLLTEKGQKKGVKAAIRLYDAYRAKAFRLKALGHYAKAIDSFEQALDHAKPLAKSGKVADLQRLAQAHLSLADCQNDAARFEEAYTHGVAGERLYAELISKGQDELTEGWARSLNGLSNYLSNLGRFDEALETIKRSEAISRKPALAKSNRPHGGWATSLANLSKRLGELGYFELALQHAEQAAAIRRDLAAEQPDEFNNDYTKSLGHLSLCLRNLGYFEEALEKAQQAETITRDLAAKQPEAHQLEWVYALANLSEAFVNGDLPMDAIRMGRQAVTLLPGLATKPGDIRTLIAEGFCLRVLAEALLQAGEMTTALGAAKRAAKSLEAAFAERPDHVAEHYVQAVITSAKCCHSSADTDGALDSLDRGVAAIGPLFEKRPRALQREMLRLLRGFRQIDASLIDRHVPAPILTTLDDLPPLRGTP